MQPRVFVYCQNPDLQNLTAFQPLLRHGGSIVHLDNKGREGRVYLHHITQNYDKLPDYTLFSQDIPVDNKLWHRFQANFCKIMKHEGEEKRRTQSCSAVNHR